MRLHEFLKKLYESAEFRRNRMCFMVHCISAVALYFYDFARIKILTATGWV
jgi:hypothetical protein